MDALGIVTLIVLALLILGAAAAVVGEDSRETTDQQFRAVRHGN
jgi:hypothetical protein